LKIIVAGAILRKGNKAQKKHGEKNYSFHDVSIKVKRYEEEKKLPIILSEHRIF